MKKIKEMDKKRRGIRQAIVWTLKIVGIVLIYILVGGIIPFVYQKDVSEEYKKAYQTSNYYSDSMSVDRASIVEDSSQALDIRIHMINAAKERILFSTFSMKPDEACTKVCAALYDAAQRGVKVQILVDGLSGSWDMKYDPMFYALGTHENVTMKYYNLFHLYAPWTFNGRLHDKFIVVDDNQLLLGGRNTSNYFLGNQNQSVLSYDREVYVYNTSATMKDSVIAQVDEYFQELWKNDLSRLAYYEVPRTKKKAVKKAIQNYKVTLEALKKSQPKLWGNVDYIEDTIAVNHIELVTNPIHMWGKEPQVWYTLEQLMRDAKKQVLIQTPYMVLNQRMYQAIEEIGEDLEEYEVLLNSIAVGDNICASSDYKYSRDNILDTGIAVYEFQGDHSMHNKSLVIDHRLAIIGSFNMDMRSTYLDTETMLVIDGKEFAKELEHNIKEMQEESLLVKKDGSYVKNEYVTAKEIPAKKKLLFSFLPFVLRPFRFLL